MSTITNLPMIPQPRRNDEDIPVSIFIGGWSAARDYVDAEPRRRYATPDSELPAPASHPLRDRLAKRRETRRLNRAFRRDQRELDRVMDACLYDPAGQRELQTIWTAGR